VVANPGPERIYVSHIDLPRNLKYPNSFFTI
jgi:hypothetical protein